ncbi:MAG: type II secretion system protein [Prochloron sp. SP5CPC1]|nr:type II secretion system protein [Candidatus Paraprochloron terpiosi SP5CPC1]
MMEVGAALLTDVKQGLCCKKPRDRDSIIKGFTLLETLVVVMIMGIMAAVATPSWLRFVSDQRLFAAQSKIYGVMKQSQNNAIRTQKTWEACFREQNDRIQWSVHQPGSDTCAPAGIVWNDLGVESIQIYNQKNDKNECETTLYQSGTSCTGTGPWRVQFNYLGHVNGRLGQITIVTNNNNQNQRCIYVSTLLGALRKGEKHERANGSDKYCY